MPKLLGELALIRVAGHFIDQISCTTRIIDILATFFQRYRCRITELTSEFAYVQAGICSSRDGIGNLPDTRLYGSSNACLRAATRRIRSGRIIA
jgi:hypothetical protein